MTTKTENLTAGEALDALLAGKKIITTRFSSNFTYDLEWAHRSDGNRLGVLIANAPFRLAKVEPQSTKEDCLDPEYKRLRDSLIMLTGKDDMTIACAMLNFANLIRTEARKIAQEEIVKLKREIESRSFKIPIEYFKSPYILTSIKGQDRGEPNE